MFERKFKFEGFDGKMYEDTWGFYLSKADLLEIQLGTFVGLDALMKRLIETKNGKEIMAIVKEIILKAVGHSSELKAAPSSRSPGSPPFPGSLLADHPPDSCFAGKRLHQGRGEAGGDHRGEPWASWRHNPSHAPRAKHCPLLQMAGIKFL